MHERFQRVLRILLMRQRRPVRSIREPAFVGSVQHLQGGRVVLQGAIRRGQAVGEATELTTMVDS
jgi:hypothetical protein